VKLPVLSVMDDSQASYGSTLGYKIVASDYPALRCCFPFDEEEGIWPTELLSGAIYNASGKDVYGDLTGRIGPAFSAAGSYGCKRTTPTNNIILSSTESQGEVWIDRASTGFIIPFTMLYRPASNAAPVHWEFMSRSLAGGVGDAIAIQWTLLGTIPAPIDGKYAMSIYNENSSFADGNYFITDTGSPPGPVVTAAQEGDATFAMVLDLEAQTCDSYAGPCEINSSYQEKTSMTASGKGVPVFDLRSARFRLECDEGDSYITGVFHTMKRPPDSEIYELLDWIWKYCRNTNKSLPPVCAEWR